VLDPVACDVECVNRHGDAVLLSHQTGLAVDRTLQEHQIGNPTGDIDAHARNLVAAFDWAELGADQAPAVGDRRGVGVQQTDEGSNVFWLPKPA
jgi:hypothetical protein